MKKAVPALFVQFYSAPFIPRVYLLFCAAAAMFVPGAAFAAGTDGATLSPAWGLPFAGLLLSIALFPLIAPGFWHAHFGKVAAAWGVLFLAPFVWLQGAGEAFALVVHAFIGEYLPFIALLAALYTVAGGICLHGKLRATPVLNVMLLAVGGLLASLMGTTGAAMLLIRPLLRANQGRKRMVHLVVFFIFIVANAGGSLTPLGDPPLFLGFLKGVGFLWTTKHLLLPMVLVCVCLLVLFYAIDAYLFRRDGPATEDPSEQGPLHLEGKRNFFLLGAVIGLVLMSGFWHSGIEFDVFGTALSLQAALRDGLLFVVLFVSLLITPAGARLGNQFDWLPIAEVAKLFAAIFVTIAPVILILGAGLHGAFAPILGLVNDAQGHPVDALYFWATGLLSGFLDNAPTYLVFFNSAGGNANELMNEGASTLTAISAGAVFMGALTYIGNAPNFMVKAIAEERGVIMPSFFGYMAWSLPILLPVFGVVAYVFF